MEKDHMEVLLEDIRSKFDLVLEGHAVLHGEIRELGRKTEERFDLVDFKIDTLNQKIDGVEQSLSARIDSVEQTLSARIEGVEQSLSAKIEGVEQNLSAKIDAVAADLSAHRHDTEAHRGAWQVRED